MKLVIFGANGRTGQQLVNQILAAGHHAVAVTRHPNTFPIAHSLLEVAGADVRDGSALPALMRDADAVLSALGVPFSRKPIDTYSVGMQNVVAAMRESGVRRLVAVSSTGAHPTPGRRDAPRALQLFEPLLKLTIGRTTYEDQRRMEDVIRGSGLDWTIVLPSGLFDLDEPTDYIAGDVDPVGAFTSRADLAHYLLALAGEAVTSGKVVTVSTVENTPTLWQMIRSEAFAP